MIKSLIRSNPPNLDGLGLGFHIHEINLSDLKIVQNNGVAFMLPNGSIKRPSKRFWLSLASRTGTSSNIFKHFSFEEVFKRFNENNTLKSVRIVEDIRNEELLAISSPQKPIITYDKICDIITKFNGCHATYDDGVIRSLYIMPGGAQFKIFDEKYTPLMLVEIPIDAYGSINIYTGCMRHKTGARIMPYDTKFKTQIACGDSDKSAYAALCQALDAYSNDECQDLLAKRLYTASKTIMSVEEYTKVVNNTKDVLTYDINNRSSAFNTLLVQTRLSQIVGNINKAYGLTSFLELSTKERASLPIACRISEMINFLSELSSFCLNDIENIKNITKINKLIGNLLTSDFDLENLLPKNKKSSDIHVEYYFSTE